MDKVGFVFNLLLYLAFVGAGIFSILEAFFPSLRDPNFNRWEVDEGTGSYVQFMGWKKIITPPRVIAQGYMSDRAACRVAIIGGSVFLLIGVLGIRHVSGFPGFLPDLIQRISSAS